MPNERNTDAIVRNLLKSNGYYQPGITLVEEQKSCNPKIDKLLQNASKQGKGKGYPDFIISFTKYPDLIIVIECKADLSRHQSQNRDKYVDYAVDGVLLYASYLKDEFNVLAVAVSGETDKEKRLSQFLWLKGNLTFKDFDGKSIISPNEFVSIIEKQNKPIQESELIKRAIQYNNELNSYSIPEVERCTFISSILMALQDEAFRTSYTAHHKSSKDNFNPNRALIKSLLSSCENVLRKNGITDTKSKVILGEYRKIEQSNILSALETRDKKKKEQIPNTILRDLINDIDRNVLPYVKQGWFDILGKFYTQFIRYAGSDQKTGLVLTPSHITDFFCDISNLNDNDKVFDPCCGTGGFLVSAMNRMLEHAHGDEKKRHTILTDQIIGIEQRPDMFSHACSNMMMRGDGKSHIHFGDCFDYDLKDKVKHEQPTKVFLNPPYDIGPDGQLEFIENAMDCFGARMGTCIAICQMSSVLNGTSSVDDAKLRLLENHTLEAVMSMPTELFYPVGVVTVIIVLKANQPHPNSKETFFGYFKDDGFIKVKNKGRLDENGQWEKIKSTWLDAYINKKSIPGLSVMKKVTAEDEWCAEAYMETDYSTLSEKDFLQTVKRYIAYQFVNDV